MSRKQWLVVAAATSVVFSCGNPDDDGPLAEDASSPEVTIQEVDEPPDEGPVDAGSETVDAPDIADEGPETDDAGEDGIEIIEAISPLQRWSPALVGNILVFVDALSMRAQLLGATLITLRSFEPGETPGSPVAIAEGLLCWDIDQNGIFEATKEDFDGDGVASAADCALHPPALSTGAAGAAVAIGLADGGCRVAVVTAAGHPVWELKWAETCLQPSIAAGALLVPLVGDKGAGVLRLLSITDGELLGQLTLSKAPVGGAARVTDDLFAVPVVGGFALIGVVTGDSVALWKAAQGSTGSDEPTSVVPAGPGRLAVTIWRPGDAEGSLGRRLVFYDISDDPTPMPGAVTLPTVLWAPPVSAQLDGVWSVIAAGRGWLGIWASDDGAATNSAKIGEGAISGLAVGGDGRIYAAELTWLGSRSTTGGPEWSVWWYDPASDVQGPAVVKSTPDADLNVRWIGSPILLCDLLVAQVIPDGDQPSWREVGKPCPSGLAPAGWARAHGDNANGGLTASTGLCAPGPGVPPCQKEGGCSDNPDCDDKNPCTIDSCVANLCSYKYIAGCCTEDEHCDDFDPCTSNHCVAEKCLFKLAPICCESSSECDDGFECTVDVCEQGFCEHLGDPTLEGCCESVSDCPIDLCATTSCDATTGACIQDAIPGCCIYDFDCDDASECTEDDCVDMMCVNTPTPEEPGCCGSDDECVNAPACFTTFCDELGSCNLEGIEDCCVDDFQCDDENPCSVDECKLNACVSTLDPTLEGCCLEDADCALEEPDLCVFETWCNVELALCESEALECDDEDDCTDDACQDGECVFTLNPMLPGCCTDDAQCGDDNLCTDDSCNVGVGCEQVPIPGCCETDEQCVDFFVATNEECVGNACVVCETFIFEAEAAPVDIVFVVDQSTSMTDLIPVVRNYLQDFAAAITELGVDYHVILVASRYKGTNAICIEPPLAGDSCKDSDTFVQIDKQVGSHDALGLVMGNIEPIEAFLRPNSARQFVVISDDESEMPGANFDFFLKSKTGFDTYTFHAIVGFDTVTCATGMGLQYLGLAASTGGLSIDICSMGWSATFSKLGESAVTATTSFALSHSPPGDPIEVSFDGVPQPAETTWTFEPSTNRIVLTAPLPEPGTVIEACYQPK